MPDYRIGRLKGRFTIVYYDATGKRRRYRLNASDADEAHRIATGVYAELTAPQGGIVADLWEAFIQDRKDRPITVTMGFTWRSLKKRFGQMRSNAICVDDCRAHIQERRDAGIKDGTIVTELGHLRMVLRWAEKRNLIPRAPYIERPSAPKPKDIHLTKTQARALITCATMPHIKLYIILALSTGARNAALLDLTWDRCDFERGMVDLRNPDIPVPHKGRAIVPMTRTLRAALLGAKPGALSDYVIEWAGQKVGSVKKSLKESANRARIDEISPHILRHSAAVHMAEDGIPMEEIAQFLGHSNPGITRRVYARYSPDYLRRAAAALEYEDLIEAVDDRKIG